MPTGVPRSTRIVLMLGVFQTAAMIWLAASALGYGDFPQLHDSATALLNGQDLYFTGHATVQGTKNLNPPHVLMLMAPLGAVRMQSAAIVMWGVILAAAVAFARALARTIPSPDSSLVFAVVLASAANSVAVSLINLAWPLAAVTAWAWIWQREGRTSRAAMAIGCLASVKLFYLIFVPYWIWRRDVRALGWSLGASAACIAIGVLVVGTGPYGEWLDVIRHGSPLLSDRPLDASWHSVVTRLSLNAATSRAIWFAGCAIVVVVSWLRLRQQSDVDTQWAILLTAMLILSPLGWIYYALIPALPVAAVLRTRCPAWVIRAVAVGIVIPPVAVVLAASQLDPWLSALVNSVYALTMTGVWLALIAGEHVGAAAADSTTPSIAADLLAPVTK